MNKEQLLQLFDNGYDLSIEIMTKDGSFFLYPESYGKRIIISKLTSGDLLPNRFEVSKYSKIITLVGH